MKKKNQIQIKQVLIDHYENIIKNEKRKEYITNYIINLYKKKGNNV